ncbi:hypothetical protein ALC57_12056 [Trachymyrmex cornetzi]|uniref:BED-type domain-containing protein n=1 Tax=Trachymyrmex cornetzi TaxID=471704 RepID=A0A151J1K0_9HYME|nr:hypothetical protein ALC57_12056 [Trachymyrmex cornetzi]
MKGHLYHEHGKYDEKDRLKWENDNDLIWRYFDKANLYTVSCKFCDNLLRQPYVPLIKSHLQNHRQEIRAAVQKEFADKSLSQYYKIDMKELNAQCKRCKDKMDIFYGTDALTHHIRECLKKYQRLKSGQKSEDNNVNRTTQQSTATENANTSSHHDNINSQPGNRENQQRLVIMIKGHLYHEHGKYDEEDLLKWENDNDLIWRYFDKAGLYKEKCKFCNDSLFVSYTPSLMDHLRQYHRQKIRASVRKEIADKSLSQYFKIHEEEFSAWCKRCNYKMDIFYGTDDLTHHICLKMNQRLRSGQKPEDDNVNRMTQQSTVTENADTSSYHDNINSQPGNRENQQRITQESIADENTNSSSHHDNLNRQALGNREDQQSSEENNMNNIVFLAHDVSDVNSHYDGTNWQGLGYQIDQQSSEENNTNNIVFLAHDVSDVSSHDGTNWQGLGYQIDQQRYENQQSSEENNTNNIVFLGHDVSDISSHYDGTNWQGLGYQIDQQSSEENNTDNIVFLGHDVSDVSSHYNGTNWQGLEYQIDQQKYVDQQSSEGNNTNSIVFLAHNVSDVNSPHDGTNWQTLGYQVDQQSYHCHVTNGYSRFQKETNVNNVHRMMDQFVAAGNVTTNFHNDDTNWQAVGYLVDQQRTNVSNMHRMMHQFVATENVATSSHNDGTTLQALGNQENQ